MKNKKAGCCAYVCQRRGEKKHTTPPLHRAQTLSKQATRQHAATHSPHMPACLPKREECGRTGGSLPGGSGSLSSRCPRVGIVDALKLPVFGVSCFRAGSASQAQAQRNAVGGGGMGGRTHPGKAASPACRSRDTSDPAWTGPDDTDQHAAAPRCCSSRSCSWCSRSSAAPASRPGRSCSPRSCTGLSTWSWTASATTRAEARRPCCCSSPLPDAAPT